MKTRNLLGTFLLLAGTWLAGRTIVAILTGAHVHADLALHALVVPAVQTFVLEAVRAVRRGGP